MTSSANRRAARPLRFASGLLPLAAGAIAWELVGRSAGLAFLPPFSRVLAAAFQLTAGGAILEPLSASLLNLLAGYGLALFSGLLLGALMGRFPMVEFVFSPYINALLAVPKLALVPVFFAIFGISPSIQIVVVFLSAFFVIVLNTMRGVQSVDPAYAEMARGFGASEGQLLRRVLLPGALPMAMAGLRLGIGQAVRGMIAAEMMVAVFGLGALLRSYGGRFDAARVFAVLLIVIGVGLVCSALVEFADRRLNAWVEAQS